jgi:hypothetical protein
MNILLVLEQDSTRRPIALGTLIEIHLMMLV